MEYWKRASDLLVAIQYNNINDAEIILNKKNIDPDISYKIGSCDNLPAICISVARRSYTMTNLLIKYGCSVNTCDDNGLTPLHLAVTHQLVDIVKLLIQNRANVNCISNYGQTPLHLAVQYSSLEIIKQLIDCGAIVNRKDSNGQTPLMIACINNSSLEIIDYLLSIDKSVNAIDNYGNTSLLYSIDCGYRLNTDIIKRLLQSGANPDYMSTSGKQPLLSVIRRSSETHLDGIETVHNLIEFNCNLDIKECNYYGETALHLSLSRGQYSIAELLIRYGCDIFERNIENLTALEYVIKYENIELLCLILKSDFLCNQINDYLNGNNYISKIISDYCKQILIDYKCLTFTLKHQCRVQIRKTIGRKSDEVITKMNLPNVIINYLLLNN